jgi:hypothetical protein
MAPRSEHPLEDFTGMWIKVLLVFVLLGGLLVFTGIAGITVSSIAETVLVMLLAVLGVSYLTALLQRLRQR